MMNYLKEVIIRIDVPSEFEFANSELPKELEKIIIPIFPVPEPRTIFGKELQISEKILVQKDIEKKEWHFFEKNKEKKLTIANKSILISYKKYKDFETLKNDWIPIINILFEIYPDIQITRLGLRYINQIPLDDNIDNWKEIISEKLLQNFHLDLNNISRGFSAINITEEDMKINFQYGIYNPDFPAPIKNYIFILDYDVYYDGLMQKQDIIDNTTKFHTKIKELHQMALGEEHDPE